MILQVLFEFTARGLIGLTAENSKIFCKMTRFYNFFRTESMSNDNLWDEDLFPIFLCILVPLYIAEKKCCTSFFRSTTQSTRKLKKVQAKKLVKLNTSIFFSWNCISGSFKLFPSSKIHFWPFLRLQKMDFGQKKFRKIDLFDFTSFFVLDFLKFSGPLWVPWRYIGWKF